MSEKQALLAALESVGQLEDETLDLAETALILSALDRPKLALDSYRQHLKSMATEAANIGGDIEHLEARVVFINRLLFETHGYAGDTEDYDNPDNANLLHVIDNRAGLPVSIGILYIHCARAAQYDITGLAFPGHFLLRISAGAGRAILDPFHGGQALVAGHLHDLLKQFMGADAELTPHHQAPVGNRDILLRLLNNIKSRALRDNDTARAAELLERMVLFAPKVANVWQELGILSAHTGKLRQAIHALETFLDFAPPDHDERAAETLLTQIKTSMN